MDLEELAQLPEEEQGKLLIHASAEGTCGEPLMISRHPQHLCRIHIDRIMINTHLEPHAGLLALPSDHNQAGQM